MSEKPTKTLAEKQDEKKAEWAFEQAHREEVIARAIAECPQNASTMHVLAHMQWLIKAGVHPTYAVGAAVELFKLEG